MENIIFETENFKVIAHQKPFIDRNEGGHIKIVTTKYVRDRLDLSNSAIVELAWLTNLVGQAYKTTMLKQGVEIIKINYQDMGNWYYKNNTPEHLHVHIFGRVINAKYQPFPESVYLPDRKTGFYDNFKPITNEDEMLLKEEINSLLKTEKYKLENWNI